MTIDWTIDFSTLLSIGGGVAVFVIIFTMMRSDIQNMSKRLEAVETSVKLLTDILSKVAEQKARIDGHSRLDRLERQVDGHSG